MNAKEARMLSQENLNRWNEQQLRNTLELIESAVSRGEFSVSVEPLTEATKTKLKDLGFRLSIDNGYLIKISW